MAKPPAKPSTKAPAKVPAETSGQTRRRSPQRPSTDDAGPIGPGSPPVHSRFKPGQSGNPAGRPRKERNLVRLIELELDAAISLSENGQVHRITKREALAKRMVNSALQGDAKAITALVRLLGAGHDQGQTEMVSVDPAIIASFLKRATSDSGREE